MLPATLYSFFFFFNDTATTEIYTLSLHDALPISSCDAARCRRCGSRRAWFRGVDVGPGCPPPADRKSTRLNSSHSQISYAVFCLKKKKKQKADPDSTIKLLCQSRRYTC